MTTTPNDALRAVRIGMRMSQDDLARQMRENGAQSANKRLIQRWESGQTATPRPSLAAALERVTGLPLSSLGFSLSVPGADVGDDGEVVVTGGAAAMPAAAAQARSNFSGIWLSRYEYHSSGRSQTFVAKHFVLMLQHGTALTVRSLPQGSSNPDSPLSMDLTLDGNVVTGTWVEQTAPDGYYKGARYHGAIQMLVEPTGRRMTGKWVGFGTEMDVNTGPWEFVFQSAGTGKADMNRFNRSPE